jgi:hypothetical protein
MKVVGTSQVFTATNGVSGASCFIWDTTNLALPVSQCSELSSNVFNASGVFLCPEVEFDVHLPPEVVD